VSGRYSGTDKRQVNHSGEITVEKQPGVHQPSLSFFYSHSRQQLLSEDGAAVVSVPQWAPPQESRKVSPLRDIGRQILQLVYSSCPVLPGNIYGSGSCKFICLP